MMDETAREPVLVDLALQGGGPHGAFTWGVLKSREKNRPRFDEHLIVRSTITREP